VTIPRIAGPADPTAGVRTRRASLKPETPCSINYETTFNTDWIGLLGEHKLRRAPSSFRWRTRICGERPATFDAMRKQRPVEPSY
jgi:hypothetical protein